MSATDSHGHTAADAELVPQPQDERLPVGKIVAVALVSAVAFALGILWAVQIMISERGTISNVGMPAPAIGQSEIGIVDHSLFALERRALQMQQDKAQRLSSYGWVSRKEQLIHVPIAEAMKSVVAGKRPQAGAGGGAEQQQQHPAMGNTDGGVMPQDPQGGAQGQGAGAGTGTAPGVPDGGTHPSITP